MENSKVCGLNNVSSVLVVVAIIGKLDFSKLFEVEIVNGIAEKVTSGWRVVSLLARSKDETIVVKFLKSEGSCLSELIVDKSTLE